MESCSPMWSASSKGMDGHKISGRNAKPDEGHAINLPANAGDAVPYVLMLLRRPGTAEVFIASPQGDLMAAFHGTAEIGYVRISNDSAMPSFIAEVAFWKSAVAKSRRTPES